jgi:hypothetical protein
LTTTLTTSRPTRFNEDLFRKETYCHGHWWHGDTCLYGVHDLGETQTEVKEERQEVAPQSEEIEVEAAPVVASGAIHDGYYTVENGGKHRTFRLRTNDADSNFAPNKQVIAFLTGSDNESDYLNFAFVIDGELKPWRRFQHGYTSVIEAAQFLLSGHADDAGKMYARESGNCYVCNRMLTDPVSIEQGIGPSCAKRVA